MSSTDISVTPELKIGDETLCLIRQDGKELFLVKGIKEATLAVDSLAAARQAEAADERTKVYREDLMEGKKVIISLQSLGTLYDGNIEQDTVLDFVSVPIAEVLKGRLEKKEEENPEEKSSEEEEEDPRKEEEIELKRESESSSYEEESTSSSDSEEDGICCDSEEWSD